MKEMAMQLTANQRRWIGGLGAAVIALGIGVVAAREWFEPGPDIAKVDDSATPERELGDGLVVPSGASLVGSVFPAIARPADPTPGWAAVLSIEGNPLVVWDRLAAQTSELGMRVPASSASCEWLIDSPASNGMQTAGLARNGAPEGTQAVVCMARAIAAEAGPNGDALQVTVNLRSNTQRAYLGLQVERDAVPQAELGTSLFRSDQRLGSTDPLPDGTTSPADRAAVPMPDSPADWPGPGEPFGSEINCLERGRDRLEVPAGSRILAVTPPGLMGRDYTAVLAVDDPEAALQSLAEQMTRGAPSDGSVELPEPARRGLPNGEVVWALDHSVEGGGGSCHMRTNPEGDVVLVLPFSD